MIRSIANPASMNAFRPGYATWLSHLSEPSSRDVLLRWRHLVLTQRRVTRRTAAPLNLGTYNISPSLFNYGRTILSVFFTGARRRQWNTSSQRSLTSMMLMRLRIRSDSTTSVGEPSPERRGDGTAGTSAADTSIADRSVHCLALCG